MSIAALREELLRELAVDALSDNPRSAWGASTDLIGWSGTHERAWVFRDRGPGLIVAHVPHGSLLWFAPGAYPDLYDAGGVGPTKRVVVADMFYRIDDTEGVSRLHVESSRGLCALFGTDGGAVHRFLENVLLGHVQDAT